MEKGRRIKPAVTIGIIGDFDPNKASHIATNNAIAHAVKFLAIKVRVNWLSTASFMQSTAAIDFSKYDGIIASPGAPYKSMDGAIKGIQAAREKNIPFIGT
jgi:CTP synthase (UTP-ammonia lyase)